MRVKIIELYNFQFSSAVHMCDVNRFCLCYFVYLQISLIKANYAHIMIIVVLKKRKMF